MTALRKPDEQAAPIAEGTTPIGTSLHGHQDRAEIGTATARELQLCLEEAVLRSFYAPAIEPRASAGTGKAVRTVIVTLGAALISGALILAATQFLAV